MLSSSVRWSNRLGKAVGAESGRFLTSNAKNYDVVVVGSGIVGSIVAAEVAAIEGLKVAVVEPSPPPKLEDIPTRAGVEEEGPDLRVFAITPNSAQILSRVGVWDRIREGGRAPSFSAMQVWESMGAGHVRFDHSVSGWGAEDLKGLLRNLGVGSGKAEPLAPTAGALAYVVENRMLQSALFDRLRDWENVEVLGGEKVESAVFPKEGGLAELGLSGGGSVKCGLVVAADGAMSNVRKLAGLGTWGWEYEQKGVVATVRVSGGGGHGDSAWQRFLPSGPVALLPLWGDYASIVWSLPTAEADEVVKLSDDEFVERLNWALSGSGSEGGGTILYGESTSGIGPGGVEGGLLTSLFATADRTIGSLASSVADRLAGEHASFHDPPTISKVEGPRGAFPLRLSGASTYTAPRLALVGDAAHTVHPLAGQGLNLGIADAHALAIAIQQAAATGTDIGSVAALQPYDSGRQRANLAMMGIIDGVKRLYAGGGATKPNPFALARTLGMGALNAIEPLKREVVLFAMGGRGSLLAKALDTLLQGPTKSSPRKGRRGSFDWL